MAREYTYTTPGSIPSGFTSEELEQSALELTPYNPLNLGLSAIGSLFDIGADTLKGVVDLGRAQGRRFDALGKDKPGLAQLAESGIGDAILNIPDKVASDFAQGIGTFGQREEIEQTPFGKGALESAPMIGTLAALPFMAGAGPTTIKAIDAAMDTITLTPGASAAINTAKSTPQMLGALGGVGAASMALPGVHYNTDPNTGKIDFGGVGKTMLAGGAAGVGLGGLIAAPALLKGGKNLLDNMVQGTSNTIKHSDQMKVVREANERFAQQQKMEQMVAQQEAQVAKQYEPEVPAPKVEKTQEPQIERTFAKETFGYEEVPNKRKLLLEEYEAKRAAEVEPLVKEKEQMTLKRDELVQNKKQLETDLKKMPEKVGRKFSTDLDESLESRIAEVLSRSRVNKNSYIKTFDKPEPQTSKQYLSAKNEGRDIDDIAQEIQNSINPDITGDANEGIEIGEAIGEFMSNYKSPKDYYRQREQQALDFRRQEAGEALKQTDAELVELENNIPIAENTIRDMEIQYKQAIEEDPRLKEYLPAVREPEPPARFIASKDGVLEVDPKTGEPIPMTKPVDVDSSGNVVIKETAQEAAQLDIPDLMAMKGVNARDLGKKKTFKDYVRGLKTVRARVYKSSKQLGNKLLRSFQDAKLAKNKIKTRTENSGLNKALSKYQNDDEVMATLGNVARGTADVNSLPPDLLEPLRKMQSDFDDIYSFLKSAGYEMPKKSEFYFPFEVRDLRKLREINDDADSIITSYLNELDKNGKKPVGLDDLSESQRDALNKRIEKEAVIQQYTPEMMQAYKSMPEALNNYVNRYAQTFGDVTLFGGRLDRNLYSELIPELVLSTDDIVAKDVPMIIDNISKLYLERDLVPSKALQAYQTAIAGLLVTGTKTLLAQMTSAITNIRKSGLLSTFEGGAKALKAMTGKAPSYTKILNPENTLQNLNDVGVDSFSQLKDFLMSKRSSVGEKAGKVVSKTTFAPLQLVDRWAEKEVTFQANEAWLKRNVDKSNFKIFEDRYGSLFDDVGQLKQDLRDLKSGKLEQPTEDIYRAVDARAGEQLVLSPMDRSLVALGSEPGKAFSTLQSFAQKLADEIDMNTRQLIMEGIKEGNPQKVASGTSMALGFGVSLPAFVFFNDLRLNGQLEPAKDKASNPVYAMSEGIRQANPVLARTLDMVATLSRPGGNRGVAVGNFAAPGSGTLLKIAGDTTSTALQGKNPYSVEDNPSAKYLPPRILMEELYNKSERKEKADVAKLKRQSNVLQREKLKKDVAYAMKHDIPINERIDSLRFKEKIQKFKDKRSMLTNYQTLDRKDATKQELFKKGYPHYQSAAMAQLKQDVSSGKITKQKAREVLNDLDSYILKKMEENFQKGKL